MGDVQMVIVMPGEEKAALIDWYDAAAVTANEYTDKCIEILVTQHKAHRASIKRFIFFDGAMGRLMQGKELDEPQAAVERAISIYWPQYLGL